MTLKEFKDQTKDLDENLELWFDISRYESEFDYDLVQSIDLNKIPMMDGTKVIFHKKVLVLEGL